jgi:hypothetical protein
MWFDKQPPIKSSQHAINVAIMPQTPPAAHQPGSRRPMVAQRGPIASQQRVQAVKCDQAAIISITGKQIIKRLNNVSY